MNTYNETLQRFADEYFRESGQQTATTKEIAAWAIRTRRWEPPTDLLIQKCREDIAKAMREQYLDEEAGKPVRAKHVARIRDSAGEQHHLWADIRLAPHEHMEIAFQQRREQIVGDCRQLKRDVDYYNGIHPDRVEIQLLLDFTDDVAEGEFSGEFQPSV